MSLGESNFTCPDYYSCKPQCFSVLVDQQLSQRFNLQEHSREQCLGEMLNGGTIGRILVVPEQGLEPWTLRLKVWCSAVWAIQALEKELKYFCQDQHCSTVNWWNFHYASCCSVEYMLHVEPGSHTAAAPEGERNLLWLQKMVCFQAWTSPASPLSC